MTDLVAARSQMALSLGFHILFAGISVALPLFMVIAELLWLRTRQEVPDPHSDRASGSTRPAASGSGGAGTAHRPLRRVGDLPQPWIREIDINPLLASPERLIALDARVVLHGPEVRGEELPRPAIRPYPVQYVGDWVLENGTPVTLRPIRPEDEPLMVRFHEALSERSVYLRYFQLLQLSQRLAHREPEQPRGKHQQGAGQRGPAGVWELPLFTKRRLLASPSAADQAGRHP